ncbi:TetR/AcrR family transcriptional regulator [Pseudomonas sp. SWRI74]|uniref:TetR/AcrR family transcriptional regulator n=1 Tax=Pseudomonas azerbaijanoccidentalis TaxID=2842347 RepID=A0ABS6QQA0_9PSED|nr:TetR/AcrR family transcriptional regulator [Pseudomonas azerbaijanoccidentalis]MBV4521118.1 TetR/AcrR family transcriptional regulator [Pseudomonas azerbaijanoccidentalis]
MPRPTKIEIDAEIIDRAAGLFSKHGFENTSLQQIANAVNYSKAGLLHHYPSKKAIYEKVLSTSIEQLKSLLASVEDIPVGIERDRAVVEATIQHTLDWPGMAAFGNRLAENEQNVEPILTEMGLIMYAALGIDLATVDLERIIRVTSAFSGLGVTAALSARLDLKREWRSYIAQIAMEALGHR